MRRCDWVQFYYFGKTTILQNEKRHQHGNTDWTFQINKKRDSKGDLSRKIIGRGRKYFFEPLALADRYDNFLEHAVGHEFKS